jgi:hypothetical protein
MAIRDDFAPGEVLAAADLNDTFGSKLPIAGGKILQIVRATDVTNRTTTSTSAVDANISVTITPQKSDSAILLLWTARVVSNGAYATLLITDSSNNPIVGSETQSGDGTDALSTGSRAIGWATPATTSATTFKGRFFTNNVAGAADINNGATTGQLFAIEVSA